MNDNDFAIAEYEQTVESYFRGVDIGFSYMKLYLTINAVLFAALLAARDKLVNEPWLTGFFPEAGIFSAIVLFAFAFVYRHQLNNCAKRAHDIERVFGIENGLFSHIRSAVTKPKLDSVHLVQLISSLFAVGWTLLLFL